MHLLTLVWLFRFLWSKGFFLAEQRFSPLLYSTRFTVDNETLLPSSASIFTRSFALVLGLFWTYWTKLRSSLGPRIRLRPERYDGWMFPPCLYLHIIVWTDERHICRHLEIASKDKTDLCKSTILFLISWLISFDFPWWFTRKQCVSNESLNTSTGVSTMNSNEVN